MNYNKAGAVGYMVLFEELNMKSYIIMSPCNLSGQTKSEKYNSY